MRRGHSLDSWETVAAGLAAGLLAHVAPAPAAALILAALARQFFVADADTSPAHDLRPLAALGFIALVSLFGGAAATLWATLVWRVGVELAARRGGAAWPLDWAAPAVAMLHLTDAPPLFVVATACVAGVLWADWIIRRLAEWRLDAPLSGVSAFLGSQGATLAPLLLFPAPQDALAALVAMRLARALAWPATQPLYATAR